MLIILKSPEKVHIADVAERVQVKNPKVNSVHRTNFHLGHAMHGIIMCVCMQ